MAKQNSNLIDALANADKAAVSNRGMYPITSAANVYKADGTPLEGDVVVDPIEDDEEEN